MYDLTYLIDPLSNMFQRFTGRLLSLTSELALSGMRQQIKCPFFKGGTYHFFRGTQRIVSVNYLFGQPLIPYDFLVTSELS